jgi:hypothetical protein
MKKFALVLALFFVSNLAICQLDSKSYSFKNQLNSTDNAMFSQIDKSMFDLYRSTQIDNEMEFVLNGQKITIVLKSANYCKQNNINFDETLSEKGKIAGVTSNTSQKFVFNVKDNFTIEDITVK